MLSLQHMLFVAVLTLICADLLRRRKYKAPKGLKLPPGPLGKPVIGHFFEISKIFDPQLMYQWRKKYGDIVSINSFGIPIIFVYSDKVANGLLVKSGATYSDRPPFVMAKLLGWTYISSLFRYGDWWRRHTRTFNQYFNSRAVTAFEPVQLRSLRLLLQDLLETPADFEEHIKFCIGRIIVDIIYAIEIKPKDDTFIGMVHVALEGLSQVMFPGTWLVDIFPILEHIPELISGLPANRLIKKYRKATQDAVEIPYNIVKTRPTPDHSFVSSSLERLRNLRLEDSSSFPDEETVIKNSAGVAYIAGAGTTYSVMLHAILASLLFPDIQKKMQTELDQVLGDDRLPTLQDRINLPYVSAFCAEVMRWRPSLPLGVAHAALEDGVYGEYFIPKGSFIIADSWQILRDQKYGPNTEKFNPERFLQPQPDGSSVPWPTEQFGFGRRECPGRFFAFNTFFLFTASIFKAFDITPMKDENGQKIPISDEIIPSAILLPTPFKCSITPRSSRVKELISRED